MRARREFVRVMMHMILRVLRMRCVDCDCLASNMARFEIMSEIDIDGVVPNAPRPARCGGSRNRMRVNPHRLEHTFTFKPIMVDGLLQLERIGALRTAAED